MSEATSSVRGSQLPPLAGDAAEPRVDGSNTSSLARPAMPNEQATVITSRNAPQTLVPISESAYRILQGKIAPGDQLGHFELVEYIGGGGMGRVFRAYDTRLARHVAVKILSPDQAADEETRLRFQNEAQSAARLDHENIARVFYVGEDHGLQYIVFEYIEGDNMRDLVDRRGPLPLSEAISFTLQVAEALDHAWQRAVVHRDIKPSNVLITREGHVKLIDMGLARLRQVDAVADLTASGVTLGTFDYISPEQARDPRAADVRSDIYSLGCTFFFMLAGRPPFPDGTVLQKLLQHQGDQPPDVRQLRSEVPDELARIVRKMLAKDPKHRYAAPRMLMDDLIAVARQSGFRSGEEGARPWMGLPRRSSSLLQRHAPWLAPVAALLAIVAALHMLWSADSRRSDGAAGLAPEAAVVEPVGDDAANQPEDLSPVKPLAAPSTAPAAAPAAGPAKRIDDVSPAFRSEMFFGLPGRQASDTGLEFEPIAFGAPRLGMRGANTVAVPVPAGPASEWTSLRTSLEPGLLGAMETRPLRDGVLSVVESPSGAGEYGSLAAACAAARDGDVIELCFQGVQEEEPIRLSKARLTIRAGEGFRPTILFRPSAVEAAGPIAAQPGPLPAAPHAMIEASGGRVTIVRAAVELAIPPQSPPRRWSLFELGGGQTLRLDGCVLTVSQAVETRDVPGSRAAVFRAVPPPRAAEDEDEQSDAALPPVILELTHCVLRGEAVAVQSEQLQPVHMTWQNGLLAVSEPLLATEGGPDTPAAADMMEVDLRHVTAYVPGGLCAFGTMRLDARDAIAAAAQDLPAEFRLADCILLGDGRRPMITHSTSAAAEVVSRRFTWSGDHNSYQNFPLLWSICGAGGNVVRQLSFEQWIEFFGSKSENLASQTPLVWKRPLDAARPMHSLVPDDFLLGESLQMPSLGDSSDGGKIGLRIETLPTPPR